MGAHLSGMEMTLDEIYRDSSRSSQERLVAVCERWADTCARSGNLAGGFEAWQDRAMQVIEEKVTDKNFAYFLNRLVADIRSPFEPDVREFVELCRRLAAEAFS